MDELYIFTECYNCGVILKPTLESYHKHNNYPVHIYGKKDDFEQLGEIKNHPNNIFIDETDNDYLKMLYNNGHAGTSYIFAKAFHPENGNRKVIHFDSDTYFRNESISLILNEFDNGYDIVSPVRCYKYNRNNRNDIRHQSDTSHTYFFGMKNKILPKRDFEYFRLMCQGHVSPTNHIILDFFDPVTYDALSNGAKIKFLDYNIVGGFDLNGSRDNKYTLFNLDFDFGDNVVHFAGVGSGYSNFVKNKNGSTYESWSLKRYYFYNYLFNDIIIGDFDKKLADDIKNEFNK